MARPPGPGPAAVARSWFGTSTASWRQFGGVIPANQAAEYEAARLLHQPVNGDLATSSSSVDASRDCRPDIAGPRFGGRGMGTLPFRRDREACPGVADDRRRADERAGAGDGSGARSC